MKSMLNTPTYILIWLIIGSGLFYDKYCVAWIGDTTLTGYNVMVIFVLVVAYIDFMYSIIRYRNEERHKNAPKIDLPPHKGERYVRVVGLDAYTCTVVKYEDGYVKYIIDGKIWYNWLDIEKFLKFHKPEGSV